MAKEPVAEITEPQEFAVTLDEFLSEIPTGQVETKAGFTRLCQLEQIAGMKMRGEWQRLYTLYSTQPTKMKWSDWIKQGGK